MPLVFSLSLSHSKRACVESQIRFHHSLSLLYTAIDKLADKDPLLCVCVVEQRMGFTSLPDSLDEHSSFVYCVSFFFFLGDYVCATCELI